MKYEDIEKRIKAIEKKEADTFNETNQQISRLKEQLEKTIEKIEETYTTGDVESGERLSGEKASLEYKINYLETFIKKRKELPGLSNEEEREIKSDLNDLMLKTLIADKKKIDSLMNEIMIVISNGDDVMKKVCDSGKTVNRLVKSKNPFAVDGRITTFYGLLKRFYSGYYANTKPTIEALVREAGH